MKQPTYTSKSLTNGIHALTGGTNPDTSTPIICLAGWPQTAESFAEVFPLLAQDHHVLILDPPGLGSSAPSPKDYTTKTISSILAAAVSTELGDQTRYHLIAHDIGAWIAYAWASQFSSSLLSVTFIDAGIPGLLPPLQFPLPEAANLRLWQFSFNALPELPEILTEGKERELLDWFFDLKCVQPERITRAKRDHYVANYSKPGGMTNGFNYYRAFAGSAKQFVDEFSQVKIPVPVLAIGAEKGMGSAMKSVLGIATTEAQSRSKLVVVDDCGHFVPEEQPEIMAKEILAFIGTC
ncbi:hypothetical protein LTR10_017477 [Elasticomyces elasticus]|uniref:AB hydrolase-1 domain-containing protein n=1 Tax=Exophiala sideris TaxID=1016849 RepID=A0ABR0JAI0_9EURO|nr:hypothetical protein LTR10_017477 [Elasticomyces elasticus]KAK5030342.1 hypothetical protein LTS07_005125 [Exophiala sideris]KAK5038395.1 hypothetical protein LTR13_004141 [Exophiala sideris]KAK5060278.1 hypothetical protein LTR69_005594 [Exophiala sideris]KAK5183189.1 hypothetical protein LTR44_004189 [Eurotiomycetes sp. CCFEE 6388]